MSSYVIEVRCSVKHVVPKFVVEVGVKNGQACCSQTQEAYALNIKATCPYLSFSSNIVAQI